MKLALALSVGLAALTAGAAQADRTHVFVRHGGPELAIDADRDGWVTRAEAAAAAERMFARLDRDDDGRLDGGDRRHAFEDFDVRVDIPDIDVDVEVEELEGGERVRVIRRIDREEIERAVREAERAAARAERLAERAERQAERAEREAERIERDIERRVERHVERDIMVVHSVPPVPAVAPVPPLPPEPPRFMMLLASAEEADRNGDGALSLDEFRTQQLRFFDASDANGDGRIRFDPPVPPAPPRAPRPPAPPAPSR